MENNFSRVMNELIIKTSIIPRFPNGSADGS